MKLNLNIKNTLKEVLNRKIKISPIIYFCDKDNFNCLCISEMHVTEINSFL